MTEPQSLRDLNVSIEDFTGTLYSFEFEMRGNTGHDDCGDWLSPEIALAALRDRLSGLTPNELGMVCDPRVVATDWIYGTGIATTSKAFDIQTWDFVK